MFFDTMRAARSYAKSQTADTWGRAHKAVPCRQWRFDRATGEYSLVACYTVVLV